MTVLILLVAAALIVAFVLSVRRDARWTGNAFLLTAAATSILFALAVGGGGGVLASVVGGGILLLIVVSPVLLLVLVTFLISNGITMIRREGRRRLHVLSAVIGVAIIPVGVLGIVGLTTLRSASWILPVILFVFLVCCWAAFLLVTYLVYAMVYPQLTSRVVADYVMVHGSRLIQGEAPPMLRRRVDAGISHWRRIRETKPEAPLILSGGRAAGQPCSEAAAMAAYAESRGVPSAAIWLEDRSPTTAANLELTRALVAERLPAGARGVTVTSDYHVVRTAALARRVGIDAAVAPSRTGRSYFPSAFLREVVIMLNFHKTVHAVVAALVCLPLPILLAVLLTQQG